ncbi:MAG: class I SAM-dependent methyltransferase [Trueperaceae bacterium]|nr:class I SAM-dependent methyltransferase [Trueperaceae bacterium]MCO5172750.1 class I SAM-dependent methyltransferase [Trueperaceae bacterium]MCW5821048.1 class I SAM-dependent methyltransferase [Trueperaceae bacterium]
MIYDTAPDIYDLQYATYRDDLPFYLRLADEYGGPVLELGCGTGRVTEALARAGHAVVAVDASAPMLERAAERLAGHDQVSLVHADMRELSLGRTFPLAVAPFNTLMHLYTLPDQDRALAAVLDHLEPAGTFAFDVYQPHLGQVGVLRREGALVAGLGRGADLFLVQEHDAERQLVESRYYLDEQGDDGRLTRRTATLTQRYFGRFELERALRHAGFADVRLYGGFDLGRWLAGSLGIVGIARKRGA